MNLKNLHDYCKNHDMDIFSGVIAPDPINIETLKSAIMIRCGLLTPVYNDPETFIAATTYWFMSKQWTFQHLINIVNAEYSPIENVDRYDNTTTTHGGSDSKNGGYKNTESGSDSKNGGYTDTNSGVDTTTNNISAFNSSAFQPDNQEQTQHGHVVTNSNNETTTYGHTLDNTNNETTTYNSNESFTQHLHGNIGVTSNQQLINQELELLSKFDIYKYIAEEFEKDNFIMVY